VGSFWAFYLTLHYPLNALMTTFDQWRKKIKESQRTYLFLWLMYQFLYARPVHFFRNGFVDLCLDIFYYFYPQEKYRDVPDAEELNL
jgi:hypothetical protein